MIGLWHRRHSTGLLAMIMAHWWRIAMRRRGVPGRRGRRGLWRGGDTSGVGVVITVGFYSCLADFVRSSSPFALRARFSFRRGGECQFRKSLVLLGSVLGWSGDCSWLRVGSGVVPLIRLLIRLLT